jgi:hypothetical protein
MKITTNSIVFVLCLLTSHVCQHADLVHGYDFTNDQYFTHLQPEEIYTELRGPYYKKEYEKNELEQRAKKNLEIAEAYERKKLIDKQKEQQAVETFTKNVAVRKMQRESRNFLQKLRYKKFKKTLKAIADTMPYDKFKKLICTSDYLKKDWLAQFIQTMESKIIFQDDNHKNLKLNNLTEKFAKSISDPDEWLNDKIIQYLPEFHRAVYETFIEKAVQQVLNHGSSWTNAVSIPAPKNHRSGVSQGQPLYPIVLSGKCYNCSNNAIHTHPSLILGDIFIELVQKIPKLFDHLFRPKANYANSIIYPDSTPPVREFTINLAGEDLMVTIPYNSKNPEQEEHDLQQNIRKEASYMLKNYLWELGFELSEEEETLQSLQSIISNDYFEPTQQTINYTTHFSDVDPYDTESQKFYDDQRKFFEKHINWASAAYQTFLLGQFIFDHDYQALEKLGGEKWLADQPLTVVNIISNSPALQMEQQRLTKMKEAFKKSKANLLTDLNTMNFNF